MDAKVVLQEVGFLKAAECLDGTPFGVSMARRIILQFEPVSMGEAISRERALRALPDIVEREDGTLEFW